MPGLLGREGIGQSERSAKGEGVIREEDGHGHEGARDHPQEPPGRSNAGPRVHGDDNDGQTGGVLDEQGHAQTRPDEEEPRRTRFKDTVSDAKQQAKGAEGEGGGALVTVEEG